MNNRSRAPKTSARFSMSYSEQEFRKLEKALSEMHALTGDDDLLCMRERAAGQITRHELRGTIPVSE